MDLVRVIVPEALRQEPCGRLGGGIALCSKGLRYRKLNRMSNIHTTISPPIIPTLVTLHILLSNLDRLSKGRWREIATF